MIKIAEMFGAEPGPLWRLAKQAGVDYAVGTLPYRAVETGEKPWELRPMRELQSRFREAGLELAVMEASPPMQQIRLGGPGRVEEIEAFKTMLRSMGELQIPVICYNFMAVLGWTRTRLAIPARGGALVTGYFDEDLRDAPLTDAGVVTEAHLWDTFENFLNAVLPTAEAAGVKMALHPDDPPLSPLRGIGRIMRSVEAFQRAVDIAPSESNGITLCQGNFTLMTDDLPAVIRQFRGKIHFVHFRDVAGTPSRFVETFHDTGKTDMLACMRAYHDIEYDGLLRPDHVPTMEGDDNENPCYSTIGRLYAIGYIAGLREAVYGKPGRRL